MLGPQIVRIAQLFVGVCVFHMSHSICFMPGRGAFDNTLVRAFGIVLLGGGHLMIVFCLLCVALGALDHLHCVLVGTHL